MPYYSGNPDDGYYTAAYSRESRLGNFRGRGRSFRGYYQNDYDTSAPNRRWTYYYDDYDAPREDALTPTYQEHERQQRRFRGNGRNLTYYPPSNIATVDDDGDEIMEKDDAEDVRLEMEQPSVDFEERHSGYHGYQQQNHYRRYGYQAFPYRQRRWDYHHTFSSGRFDRVQRSSPVFKRARGRGFGRNSRGYTRGPFYNYGRVRLTKYQRKFHLENEKRADWRQLQENLCHRAEPGQLNLSSTRAVNLSLDDIISSVTSGKRARTQ